MVPEIVKGQIPDSGINEATMNGITLRKKQTDHGVCGDRQCMHLSLCLDLDIQYRKKSCQEFLITSVYQYRQA